MHEAYLRLVGVRDGQFNNRVHFFGAAAQAMRRVLVDHARRRNAVRRGNDPILLKLDDVPGPGAGSSVDLVELDEALEQLAMVEPRPAQVVELRYFGGMSIDEVAAFLSVSPVTVKRDWAMARAWLHRALHDTPR